MQTAQQGDVYAHMR